MIYITGDTHRRFDRIEYFCKENKTTKEDVIIILGDAGINYFGDRSDRRLKMRLESFPITFMLIHGNHEMRPSKDWPIRTQANESYTGSFIIEQDFPSLLYMQDGKMYTLNTSNGWKNAFVIGGAYSVDKYYRLGSYAAGNHNALWFEDEQLSDLERKQTKNNMKTAQKRGQKSDFIFTHTCPLSMEPVDMFLPMINQDTVDRSMEIFLDDIKQMLEDENGKPTYEKWFCGHWHTDRTAPDNFRFMFNDIIAL